MSTNARYPVIITAPALAPATATVTQEHNGASATLFAAVSGASTVSQPVTVAAGASTTVWLPEDVYIVSATVAGVEMADGEGSTKRIVANGPNALLLDAPSLAGSGAGARSVLDVMGAFPVTFEAITPALIAGNVLTLAQQQGGGNLFSGFVNATASTITNGGADGGDARRITATAANFQAFPSAFADRAPVVAGTSYTLSARVKASAAFTGFMLMTWVDAGNATISSASTGAIAFDTTTKTFTITGTAPAGAVKATTVLGVTGGAAADFFDVSVVCIRTSATIPGSSGVRVRYPDGSVAPVTVPFTSCAAVVSGSLVLTSADSVAANQQCGFALPSSWSNVTGKVIRANYAVQTLSPGTTTLVISRFSRAGTDLNDYELSNVGPNAVKRYGITHAITVGTTGIYGLGIFTFSGTTMPNGAPLIIHPILFEVAGA